jgi:hypothetical protein
MPVVFSQNSTHEKYSPKLGHVGEKNGELDGQMVFRTTFLMTKSLCGTTAILILIPINLN